MSFIKNEYINSFIINEKNQSHNSYPTSHEINIIHREDCLIYPEKDDNNKDTIEYFDPKITKDNSREVDYLNQEDLIDEKNLFFIDKERQFDKISFLKENPIKTQKEKGKEDKKIKKFLGQKMKRNEENYEKHDKYSDDVIRRKCKYLLLKNLFEFLNTKIKNIYKGKLGHSIFKKELKKINHNQILNSNIDCNQTFLTKTIGDIFSEDITNKYTNFPINHNKILINNLMNENDESKRIYFQKLFSLNFIQCLRHFSGKEHNNLLLGLKCFKDLKNEIINKYKEEGDEYFNVLEYYLGNYEEIVNKKRARIPRK